jgi:hypothetical protein
MMHSFFYGADRVNILIDLTLRPERLTESGSPGRYHRRGQVKRRRDEDIFDGCADRSL